MVLYGACTRTEVEAKGRHEIEGEEYCFREVECLIGKEGIGGDGERQLIYFGGWQEERS